MLPHGKAAKLFVQETADLFDAYANKSSYESVALKVCFLMHVLLLQKPAQKSKARDHSQNLGRCVDMWKEGKIDALLAEGRCIQAHLPNGLQRKSDESIARVFSKMFVGDVRGALNHLSRNATGSP